MRRFLDLWRSHNVLNSSATPEQITWLLREVARLLPEQGEVPVPYLCRAWTCRRVDRSAPID